MAELVRPAPVSAGGLFKDKLGSPSTGSEDGGGGDLADLAADLDLDDVDGPSANGYFINIYLIILGQSFTLLIFSILNGRTPGSLGAAGVRVVSW